jgi:hypothetical protein
MFWLEYFLITIKYTYVFKVFEYMVINKKWEIPKIIIRIITTKIRIWIHLLKVKIKQAGNRPIYILYEKTL